MEKQKGLTLIEILISVGLAVLVIGGGFLLYTNSGDTNIITQQKEANTERYSECGEEPQLLDFWDIDPELLPLADPPVEALDNYNRALEDWEDCVEKSESETTSGEETPIATSEGTVDEGLQTYTNEEYDFEISYPEKFEFGGENPREKLLFSLTDVSGENTYEFWIRELNGKTLEAVFEEKLNLEDISYFDWIRDQGGEVTEENIGQNSWLFVDGSAKFYLDSHYMVSIPGSDAYLVVDLDFPEESEFETIKKILSTLKFNG